MADRTNEIAAFLATDAWTVPDVPENERWQAVYEHVAEHFEGLTKAEFARAFRLAVEIVRPDAAREGQRTVQ